MAVSQNGWVANNRSLVSSRQVPDTDVRLTVRNGIPGDLLLWVAEQIDKRVESIDNGRGALDDWGYAERPIRGGVELSNHASGTAIDLNAPRHPLGAVNTFNAGQRAEIRKIIAETGGAVRWGGDYVGRKDDMHFELDKDLAGVTRAWNTIQARKKTLHDAELQEEDMPVIPFELKTGFAYDVTGDNRTNPENLTVVTGEWANFSAVGGLGKGRIALGKAWGGEGQRVRLRIDICVPGDKGGVWWPRIGRANVPGAGLVTDLDGDYPFHAEDVPDKSHIYVIGRMPFTKDDKQDWFPVSGSLFYSPKS